MLTRATESGCVLHCSSASKKDKSIPATSFSHRIMLDQAPEMYKSWHDKEHRVTKIVIDPWANEAGTRARNRNA